MKKTNVLKTDNGSNNIVIGTKNDRIGFEVTLSKEEKLENLIEECKAYGLEKSIDGIKAFFQNCFDWNIGDKCIHQIKEMKLEGNKVKSYSLFWNGTAKVSSVPELRIKFVNEGNVLGTKTVTSDRTIKSSEIIVVESVFENDMNIKPVMEVNVEL